MTPALPPFPDDDAWRAGTPARLTLAGPAGAIEAILDAPDAGVPEQPVVAVFCHPLPTGGGTMHNKVVTMGCRALRELGVATLRFNFRGTGASEGTFDHGDGESDDLRAVVAWVRAHRPGHLLWLAGFSFGAYVSLRCAAELQPRLLVSVAPPAGRSWDFDAMPLYTGPWIVIQGEADEIVEVDKVYRWLERIAELRQPPELVAIPDSSHFFHGKLMDLRGAIRTAARPWLPLPVPPAHG
jgi:alpha/beta superfamily hydrolase